MNVSCVWVLTHTTTFSERWRWGTVWHRVTGSCDWPWELEEAGCRPQCWLPGQLCPAARASFLSNALCFFASPGRTVGRLWWLSLWGFAITVPDMDDLSREWGEDPEVGRAPQRSSIHRTTRKLRSGRLIFSDFPFISFRPQT